MADNHLQNPIFQDADLARQWLEARIWPKGPVCPHCGSFNATKLEGKAHRPGLYQCNEPECREQYTVTVGTLFERSKIPLNKWLMALYLLMASKKGMSALQMSRMLGISYKSTWFVMHRLREALREGKFSGPIGGDNKVVEADETYVGGKAINRKNKVPAKEAAFALVERDGKVRTFHVPKVNAKTLKPIVDAQIHRDSYVMTDDATVYPSILKEFKGHGSVNHSAQEYVRGMFWHINTVENYFSILKRGITGTYHHVSQQHLKRYLAEFDFRYNERKNLGVTDMERTEKAAKGIVGKRLTYRRTRQHKEAEAV
ncbi:MAG: IS1595 family transposase [Rhodospirillaceae bacterium]|nr:IS1595 family transposase [Rhodospirillaceae bacterium]